MHHAELRRYGVQVWCRGVSPITGKMLGLGSGFCIPVSCGGVAVNPGDAIVADECDVLVLKPGDIEEAAKPCDCDAGGGEDHPQAAGWR